MVAIAEDQYEHFEDAYVHAADRLNHAGRAQLIPHTIRRVTTWLTATAASFAMALLTYVVLLSLLSFPPTIAFLAASVLQMIGVVVTHSYFHAVRSGESRWNWFLWVSLVVSFIVLGIAYLRAHMYVEDLDMAPFMAALISVLVALIEPVATWVMGGMTAAAQIRHEFQAQLLAWCKQLKDAIEASTDRGNTWGVAVDRAYRDMDREANRLTLSAQDIARRDAKVGLHREYIRLLELYYPGQRGSEDALFGRSKTRA